MEIENRDLKNERIRSENVIRQESYEFMAKYLAVGQLCAMAETNPDVFRLKTVFILKGLFTDAIVYRQTQAYFLHKETANTLCRLAVSSQSSPVALEARHAVMDLLQTSRGRTHRAVAEAMGSLPFTVEGPTIRNGHGTDIPVVGWDDLLEETGMVLHDTPFFMGRSLVGLTGHGRGILVVKLAGAQHSPQSLRAETDWLEHMRNGGYSFPVKFHVPQPLKVQNSSLFQLEDLPVPIPENGALHPDRHAIAFLTGKDYFLYPNESAPEKRLNPDQFKEVLSRNAFLFGRLSSLGILHTAPIPLFHNRVQGFRRDDHGLYEWQRAGRLDRWLESCLHPNFGVSGIRDFEHFESFKGQSRMLYPHMGTQLLSLFLVIGSYFRNKDTSKVGFDRQGNPVDARDCFDKPFLRELLEGIFSHYYLGFVGKTFEGDSPLDLDGLAGRMVEEMGVDRFMEEILRATDQQAMNDEAFFSFLEQRGFSKEEARRRKRGEEDITLFTGPHLGGFNQRISIPELIESVGTMAALCIYGKYRELYGG